MTKNAKKTKIDFLVLKVCFHRSRHNYCLRNFLRRIYLKYSHLLGEKNFAEHINQYFMKGREDVSCRNHLNCTVLMDETFWPTMTHGNVIISIVNSFYQCTAKMISWWVLSIGQKKNFGMVCFQMEPRWKVTRVSLGKPTVPPGYGLASQILETNSILDPHWSKCSNRFIIVRIRVTPTHQKIIHSSTKRHLSENQKIRHRIVRTKKWGQLS